MEISRGIVKSLRIRIRISAGLWAKMRFRACSLLFNVMIILLTLQRCPSEDTSLPETRFAESRASMGYKETARFDADGVKMVEYELRPRYEVNQIIGLITRPAFDSDEFDDGGHVESYGLDILEGAPIEGAAGTASGIDFNFQSEGGTIEDEPPEDEIDKETVVKDQNLPGATSTFSNGNISETPKLTGIRTEAYDDGR